MSALSDDEGSGGGLAPGGPTRVLCLGEPRVELICERPLDDLAGADAFIPHPGGVAANVAVIAARGGAHVTLAGGAGDDDWGRWLRERLALEGVDLSMFELVPGAQTPLALVHVDAAAQPHDALYGASPGALVALGAERLEQAVRDSAALVLSSSTLVDEAEREIVYAARAAALELDRPVIFEVGLRRSDWRSRADAAATCNACVPGALLVRVDAAEAALLTGEHEVERAAMALVKAGAQLVVITLGADGAILRGKLRVDVGPVRTQAISLAGAGDTVTGFLLGKLAASGFYPPTVAASLREAVVAAARTTERWGALE